LVRLQIEPGYPALAGASGLYGDSAIILSMLTQLVEWRCSTGYNDRPV